MRRRQRSAYLLELRHALSRQAGEEDDPTGTEDFETHHFIGRSVAVFLLNEPDETERQKLSAEFFARGPDKGRRYPTEEVIIETLFRDGVLRRGEHRSFRRVHSELFQRCFGVDGVLLGGARWAVVSALGERFLGAGMNSLDKIWTAERTSLLEALEETWQRWVAVFFPGWGTGTAFLRLLRTPATRARRIPFMRLIARGLVEETGDTEEFEGALLDLLLVCWEENLKEIEDHPESRQVFLSALRRLVRRGAPDAILLEQEATLRWAPQ